VLDSLCWAHDQVAILNQPVVKLVGGVDAVGLTDGANLFVLGQAFRLGVEQNLNRAGQIFAKLAPLIFHVTFKSHVVLLFMGALRLRIGFHLLFGFRAQLERIDVDDQRDEQNEEEFEWANAQYFHIPLTFFYRVNYL
jgi:hypothetical protein